MTKKHYEAIAAILKKYGSEHDNVIEFALADYFTTDNKLFDRTRFLQACGVEQVWTCGNCGTKFPLLPHSQKCPQCSETVG